jgi:hypothetical protein
MTDSRRTNLERKQLGMLAALGLVLLALVYLLFLRGGEPQKVAPASSAPAPALAQAGSEDPFIPEEDADASSQPVETYEVFASRDPFEPVIEGGDTGEDNGDPEDPANDEPGDGPAGRGQEQDPDDDEVEFETGVQANEEQVEDHEVKLIDVYREAGENRAQVEIDSTGYTVAEGEVFAENFQLMSTSGTCATMLYGDDQFTLCEGDAILK